MKDARTPPRKPWKSRTRAVHSGTRRSQYGEVSEALFLTQGFVYDTAEAAKARFIETGPDEYIYARYGNPTVAMFEDRIAALEGAEDAFATASGMAAVKRRADGDAQGGRPRGLGARAFRLLPLYPRGVSCRATASEVSFVDGTDLAAWEAAIRPDTKGRVLRIHVEPDAGADRHRRRLAPCPCRRLRP